MVAPSLVRVVGGSCSRARWPPLRRRSGRLGRWPRSPVRPRDGLARGLCALPARPRLASGRLPGCWPQRLPWRGAELAVLFRGGLPPFPRRARLRALPPSPRRAPPSGSHPSGNFSGGRGARSRAPRLRRGRLRAGRAPLHPRCLCGLPPGLWPCALRLPRRVRRPRPAARVAPVVWWSGSGAEGVLNPPA